MKGVGTFIKIKIHTLMENEHENKIDKITNFQIQVIPHSICISFINVCFICKYLMYFGVFNINILIEDHFSMTFFAK